MEPFISMILPWPGNFAPRGWAFCQGQIISITQNQTLFSLLGVNYGGDGVTNFGLPDLQGRSIVGAGLYPGMPNLRLGAQGGQPYTVLSIDEMPEHTHEITHTLTPTVGADASNIGTLDTPADNTVLAKAKSASTDHMVNMYSTEPATVDIAGVGISGSITAKNTGKGEVFGLYHPFTVLNYIIALDGIYPSRP